VHSLISRFARLFISQLAKGSYFKPYIALVHAQQLFVPLIIIGN